MGGDFIESFGAGTRGDDDDSEQVGWLDRKSPTMLDRLVELREAGLRISENLDLNVVLQKVADEARTLTAARYSAVLIFDEAGEVRDLAVSGLTPEEIERVGSWPKAPGLLGHIRGIQRPLRLAEIANHEMSFGFPGHHRRMKSLLGTPIRHRGEPIGNIYLTDKEGDLEFSPEDEEVLGMFASQAALAIINALRYRDEQQARANLQALVDISPVGVLIFDGKTRELLSRNPETLRIVRGHHTPGRSLQEILSLLTFRHPDGRQMTPEELPLERAIRNGETVRAEEIVIHLPDGQAVTTVVSAAPIFSEAGRVESVVATMQDMTPLEELERQRAEFLGMVSHELRSPLTTIKGSTAIVLGSPSLIDPVEMHHFFKIIDEQADRMHNLIAALIDMTRIEAGMLSVTPEPTSVADVIYALRRLSEDKPEKYHVQIMELLCAFVRYPKFDEDLNKQESILRTDVQEIMRGIGSRSIESISLERSEDFKLYLRGANMSCLQVQRARLSRAWLTKANLSGAVLPDADLSGARLRRANLSEVKLWGANLSKAILRDANVSGADLYGFDARSSTYNKPVYGLTQAQLDEAVADPDNPPKLEGVLDAETGEQLIWRGGPTEEE